MSLLNRYQWHIVTTVFLVAAAPLILKLQTLLPLYVDDDLRSRVETRVREIADERGWLLSNLSMAAVTRENFTLCHREHWRGPDLIECDTFQLQAQ